MKRFLAAGASLALVALMLPGATAPALGATTYNDVYICTYVGTPGVDQSLTGIGPLGTLTNATPGTWFQYPAGNTVGSLAYVVAYIDVPPQPQPPLSACPAPSNSSTNATIHFFKTVDNTFGGTAAPADWTMTLTPCSSIDPTVGCQFPSGHNGDVMQVAPGPYHLDEAADPSVTQPYQSQTGGCFSSIASASGFAQDVTFAAGETWYCGFVNQVQPATVIFSNTFVGGPTPPPVFTMHMTSGTNTYSGADGGFVDMLPGTYTLTEDQIPGYTSDAGVCFDLIGSATTGPTITVTNGDLWQCGFTNTYGSHFSVSGFPSPTVAGASHDVTVTALDASNNTDPTYTGTVHFTSTDGAAVLPADSTLTNGTGVFAVTLATAGTQTITATDTVTATIAGSETGINVQLPLSGATYVSLTPARILDTRSNTGLAGTFSTTVPRALQVAGVAGVPSNAIAVTGNLTVTNQSRPGFLALTTVSTPSPTTSTLNFPTGDNRATGVTAALGSGGVLWITYVGSAGGATTDVLFDVTGYFEP